MAITLNDLKERLEGVRDEITQCNYGNAYTRISNTIRVIEESGITIHATATTKSKKVESDGNNEEE